MKASRARPGLSARVAPMVRRILALGVLGLASYGLVAAGELADRLGGLVASWQLFPWASRLLALGLGGAGSLGLASSLLGLGLVLVSAIAGRWYCSFLCPLGGLQDLVALIARPRLGFGRPLPGPRLALLTLALALVAAGLPSLASWIDPWSSLGRFAGYALGPLARLLERADILGFDPWLCVFSVAAMAGILILAGLKGRWFCGQVCPLGTALGGLNRLAPLRLRLDGSTCISCGRCEEVCVGSCISAEKRELDESRCVYCLSCLGDCPVGAIYYGPRRASSVPRMGASGQGISRGRFLASFGGGVLALAAGALGRGRFLPGLGGGPGGLMPGPVSPPGAGSRARLEATCTGCGLCVARCPSAVLQPGGLESGLLGAFLPRLDHSLSYCQFDCTICLDLCPSGALERLGLATKKLTKIGNASLVREKCVVFTQGTKCGSCAEHCPTGAVRMVEGERGLPEPVFHEDICIGCGACHYACPVRPQRAITVSGLAVHRLAQAPAKDLFKLPDLKAQADKAGPGSPETGEDPEAFPF